MLVIPFSHRRVLVHVLDNVAPSDTRIVRAEANFTFLRSVRNDAHLGAAKIVVEQILKPHPGDKQEVPTIGTSLLDIVSATVTTDFPIVLAGQPKRLIELLKELIKVELGRRHFRLVML